MTTVLKNGIAFVDGSFSPKTILPVSHTISRFTFPQNGERNDGLKSA